MTPTYLCDWWLEDRSKCPATATEWTEDRDGATLRFCVEHKPVAYLQYHVCGGVCNDGRPCHHWEHKGR